MKIGRVHASHTSPLLSWSLVSLTLLCQCSQVPLSPTTYSNIVSSPVAAGSGNLLSCCCRNCCSCNKHTGMHIQVCTYRYTHTGIHWASMHSSITDTSSLQLNSANSYFHCNIKKHYEKLRQTMAACCMFVFFMYFSFRRIKFVRSFIIMSLKLICHTYGINGYEEKFVPQFDEQMVGD